MSNNDINRYYRILGLQPGASLLEIKQAYRNLVKTEHPDLFDRNPLLKREAEEKFRQINEAYQQLRKFHQSGAANQTFTSAGSTTRSGAANQTVTSNANTTTSPPPNQTSNSSNQRSNWSNLNPYLRGILPIAIGANIIFLGYLAYNNFKPENNSAQNNFSPQPTPPEQNNSSPQPTPPEQTATISLPPPQCRVVVPTIGNSARIFSQPSREADTGKRIPQNTKVSFISGIREFVEVKLTDGSSGWVFNDQIYPCKLPSDSGAEIASVSQEPRKYVLIAPTVGSGARIFSQPSRNTYIGKRIPKDTKVSLIGEQQEFLEIRLADGSTGWVFNDQVNPINIPTETPEQIASIPVESQQCRVVLPTIGNSARVFTQPSREAYTGKKIPQDTRVSFISGVREFVEIRLADGSTGWMFNDQVYPCKVQSNSRSQIATISEQQKQCLVIAGGSRARIFSQPSRNADLGRRIPPGTRATLLGEQQEFVKIRLADGNTVWVFNDRVQPCTEP